MVLSALLDTFTFSRSTAAKIRFLPHYPSRRENSPLNLTIPEEKFGHLSAISADDGVSFCLFRALYSHKAHCLNQ